MTDKEVKQALAVDTKVSLTLKVAWAILLSLFGGGVAAGIAHANMTNQIARLSEAMERTDARVTHIEQTYLRRADISTLVEEVFRRSP